MDPLSIAASCVIGLPLFIWFVGSKAFEVLAVIGILLYPVMLICVIGAAIFHYL
jgi:hypothetical protein